MRMIYISATALLLSGCATQPSSKMGAQAPVTMVAAAPISSSNVAIKAVSPSALKGAAVCPADGRWEKSAWKQVMAFANACVKTGEWSKVERMGRSLAINQHQGPWGPYFMSLAAGQRRDFPRAIWLLELGLKKAPREGLLHYQLARVNWQQGDESAAVEHMRLASEYNTSVWEAHWVLARLALERREIPEAEKYLERVITANPAHGQAREQLAKLREENLKKMVAK